MNQGLSDLKRVLSASGIYAFAAVAQRGLAFLLLPVYTRFIDPAEYGVLELLTTFSIIVFGVLMLGQPSAIVKCFHRDSETAADQASILPTALSLVGPTLLVGAGVLSLFSNEVGRLLTGTDSAGGLVRLVLATGVLSSLSALTLASMRAKERAVAFSVLTLLQFTIALTLNIILVVKFEMGVRGVLWGNLASNVIALPVALAVAHRDIRMHPRAHLVGPLLRFGLLLIPVVLAGWVTNMSDRYILRLFHDLADVAIYGVGYKVGMIMELTVVWPFQLAWPAVSFSISHREGHRVTYAKALTYLTALLAYVTVGLSLVARVAVPWIVGAGYRDAYLVVPLIAVAYALNGIPYCVAPGIHITGKTKYLTYVSIAAAALNLGLNFLLIPKWGIMGAAWSTVASFLLVAVVTTFASWKLYAVEYEYKRLLKIIVAGLVAYFLGAQVQPEAELFSIAWHVLVAVGAFPALIVLFGVVDDSERSLIRSLIRRLASRIRGA